mmetsp:Transcript_18285/g.28955  ORF Transcript_18285/g.28955 Transcript_18285/m.28955 type:complete len:247 (-) Transcript_18285:1157-1897(-)
MIRFHLLLLAHLFPLLHLFNELTQLLQLNTKHRLLRRQLLQQLLFSLTCLLHLLLFLRQQRFQLRNAFPQRLRVRRNHNTFLAILTAGFIRGLQLLFVLLIKLIEFLSLRLIECFQLCNLVLQVFFILRRIRFQIVQLHGKRRILVITARLIIHHIFQLLVECIILRLQLQNLSLESLHLLLVLLIVGNGIRSHHLFLMLLIQTECFQLLNLVIQSVRLLLRRVQLFTVRVSLFLQPLRVVRHLRL